MVFETTRFAARLCPRFKHGKAAFIGNGVVVAGAGQLFVSVWVVFAGVGHAFACVGGAFVSVGDAFSAVTATLAGVGVAFSDVCKFIASVQVGVRCVVIALPGAREVISGSLLYPAEPKTT